jgi:hypothetical protein
VLASSAVACLVVGATLFGVGHAQITDFNSTLSYQGFARGYPGAAESWRLEEAGTAFLAVAGALSIGAIVRWLLVEHAFNQAHTLASATEAR